MSEERVEREEVSETGEESWVDNAGGLETDGTEVESKPKNGKRRKIFMIGGIVLVVGAVVGLAYWLYARQFESTDDAFIDADIVQISPKVAAYVSKVYVESNQFVHKGDLLVELDPSDLQVRLEQAKAQLENARSQRNAAQANVALTTRTTAAGQAAAQSNVQSARTNVEQTRLAASAKQSQ